MGRELADAVDPADDDIARLQPAIGAGRRRQTGRGPRRDQVRRSKLEMPAEERDDLADREAHLRGPTVLDRLAIDRAAEPDVARVELLGGDEPGPDRAEAGHGLPDQPLVAVEPRVAGRHVVD